MVGIDAIHRLHVEGLVVGLKPLFLRVKANKEPYIHIKILRNTLLALHTGFDVTARGLIATSQDSIERCHTPRRRTREW